MPFGKLPRHWSASGRPWQIDLEKGKFVSPFPKLGENEFLMAGRTIGDGSISAVMNFPKEGVRDAAFVFRSRGEYQGYLVGVGGWDSRYVVAEMQPTPQPWNLLAKMGESGDLQGRRKFRLRVEFTGSNIRLYENNVEQINLTNERFRQGQVGLYASSPHVTFSEVEVSQGRCFVVMPFANSFNGVFEDIKAAVEARDLLCVRSDESYITRPIMTQVIEQIRQADLIIVDLSGQNANVYYEAGVAHAFRKNCVVIAENPSDVTFDVKHMRILFYGDRRHALREELEQWIGAALDDRPNEH